MLFQDENFSLLASEIYEVNKNGELAQRSDADANGLTIEDKMHIWNFIQLKLVILFLQKGQLKLYTYQKKTLNALPFS